MADTMPTWSRRLLELGHRCGEIPIYGSPEWHALPPTDPRRFAAVVRAAECWRQDGEPDAIRRRLLHDTTETEEILSWRIRRASNDIALAQDWEETARRIGDRPTTRAGWISLWEANATRLADLMAMQAERRLIEQTTTARARHLRALKGGAA